jgi:hypothetical protein
LIGRILRKNIAEEKTEDIEDIVNRVMEEMLGEQAEMMNEVPRITREDNGESADPIEGTAEIVLIPPADSVQIGKLEEELGLVRNLRIILIEGSEDKGTRIVVSALQPMFLTDVIGEISVVQQVTRKDKQIQVSLRPRPSD